MPITIALALGKKIMHEMENACPLCSSKRISFFHADATREYFRCSECHLVFVPPKYHVSDAEEKAEYDLHDNRDTPGYRNFLSRLADPLLAVLKEKRGEVKDLDSVTLLPKAMQKGLDFGCGPQPVLARMFEETGYTMQVYDKFYYANENIWKEQYDFITASEVVEHLREPRETLLKLWQQLNPGGILAVMTGFAPESAEEFARWKYIRDKTHILFFPEATFRYIAQGVLPQVIKISFPEKNVVVIVRD